MKRLRLTIALSASVALLTGYVLKDRLLPAAVSQMSEPSDTLSATEKLAAARKLAWEASVLVRRPPHAVEVWQQAKVKWRQAIRLLEAIPSNAPVAVEATQQLQTYQANYTAISRRLDSEQAARSSLAAAQTLAWQAAVTGQNPPHSLKVWQRAHEKWQEAIDLLQSIPSTTAVAAQSRQKLTTYRASQAAIARRMETEAKALTTLRQFADVATRLNRLPTQALAGQTVEQVGIEYREYADLVQTLEGSLAQLAREPGAKNHRVYADLSEAVKDYQFALNLWKSYLDFKQENVRWLYDDLFNELVPVSLTDRSTLLEKYRVKTYSNGKKVSLRFSIWEIWDHASDQVNRARQNVMSLS